MNRVKQPDLFLYLLYGVLFISMFCCFRAVTSITTGALLLTNLVKTKTDTGSFFNTRLKNIFFAACCLFYAIQLATAWHGALIDETVKDLSTKSALVFVPLTICSSRFLDAGTWKNLMRLFVWLLVLVMIYCIAAAAFKYLFSNATADVFFYHALVLPFNQHAVQVSIYLFVGLVYLLDQRYRGVWFHGRNIHFLVLVFFIGCMLLLSSKLVISFSLLCLLWYALLVLKTTVVNRMATGFILLAGCITILLVLVTQNRVSKRFSEILDGSLSIVKEKQFTPAVYFNGLQFRLLEWRFVAEILTEQSAWKMGVAEQAQPLLDKKYTSTHMYTGGISTAGRGYLSYNTHNQFLQSLLESGIPGLMVFMTICCSMVYLALRRKERTVVIVVCLLIAYCFNEAVFETQYGLTLFTFLPLFFYYGAEKATVHQR